ncbi:MAG: hypothetical protein DRP64_14975, partial [Verrucomicrobia bacterium]
MIFEASTEQKSRSWVYGMWWFAMKIQKGKYIKMKHITAVAMVALLGSLSANATLVVYDPFDGGEGTGLNNNIHIRQAGSPEANWTSYTLSGSGTFDA